MKMSSIVHFTEYEFRCLIDDNKLLFADSNGFAYIIVYEPYDDEECDEELIIIYQDDKLVGTEVSIIWDENIDSFVKQTYLSRECRRYIREQEYWMRELMSD